jgi:hypothetical protein
MATPEKKQASPKADKLKGFKEQAAKNMKTPDNVFGKRKADNEARVKELKGNKKNKIK